MWRFVLAILVLPCLHAEPAVNGSCSTSDGSCSSEQASEQQAFIQTKQIHLHKGSDIAAAAGDELHDLSDPESSYLPEELAVLQTASMIQQLKVSLSEDEAYATISFVAGGQSYKYEMNSEIIYSPNANISVFTNSGDWEYMHPGKPRTFNSPPHSEGYAKARINEDMSVSGLFEHKDGQVIDVRPLRPESTHDSAYSLLAEQQGGGRVHVFEYVGPLDLESNPYVALMQKPFKEESKKEAGEFSPDHGNPTGPKPPQKNWKGKKWYPGCYSNDIYPHVAEIGFVVPSNVFFGGVSTETPTLALAKAKWEDYLVKASYIYEKQMNLKLVLSEVKVDQSPESGLSWSKPCGADKANAVPDMMKMTKPALGSGQLPQPNAAAWYAFTNCGNTWGIMGQSYIGSLCYFKKGYNLASGKYFHETAWKTVAHEIGHIFKAKHSFAEGKGKTGGIMDYGDGKKDGHYQFNTKYRKAEMCSLINKKMKSCNGHIERA